MSNLELAIELCTKLYNNLSPIGIFPALTGGTLYKEGERKDIDIVLYASDNGREICCDDVKVILINSGVFSIQNYGRVIKASYHGVAIDFILPEFEGEYPPAKENE